MHNKVKSLADVSAILQKLCPSVEIASAHGQMEAEKLEKVLLDFIDHKFDVLVCTNIIETGLDIPNVNTILINNAHQFGLSDLHQLRGRVGRSNRKAYCYLLAPPSSTLTMDARKDLKPSKNFLTWAVASMWLCEIWIFVEPAIYWEESKAVLLQILDMKPINEF